jgi:hypothetical protein
MISVDEDRCLPRAQTTLYLMQRCTVDFRNICVRVDATASIVRTTLESGCVAAAPCTGGSGQQRKFSDMLPPLSGRNSA